MATTFPTPSKIPLILLMGTRTEQVAATSVIAGTLYYVTDEGVLERAWGTDGWQSYGPNGLLPILAADPVPLVDNTAWILVAAGPVFTPKFQYGGITYTGDPFNVTP